MPYPCGEGPVGEAQAEAAAKRKDREADPNDYTPGAKGGCFECNHWTGPRNFYFGDPAGVCAKGHWPCKAYAFHGGKQMMRGSEVQKYDTSQCKDF